MVPVPSMMPSTSEKTLAPAAIAAARRDELAGGYLIEEEVRSRLAIDPETLVRWRKERKILAIWHTPRKPYLFPPCQFVGAQLLPEIETLLMMREVVGSDRSGWSMVEWLLTPHVLLNDQRPADLLESNPDRVVAAAKVEFSEFSRDRERHIISVI